MILGFNSKTVALNLLPADLRTGAFKKLGHSITEILLVMLPGMHYALGLPLYPWHCKLSWGMQQVWAQMSSTAMRISNFLRSTTVKYFVFQANSRQRQQTRHKL